MPQRVRGVEVVLPLESYVLWITPRAVQVEHPAPIRIRIQPQATNLFGNIGGRVAQRIRHGVTVNVRVNVGLCAERPATVTVTGPVAAYPPVSQHIECHSNW